MRLASPNTLWWLSLAALIIFFYLLKLKRKKTIVPSIFLWQRALEEIEANAPFKKLRRNLLLLLQLLVLAALVFALARPLISTRALAAGTTIVILDSTASMSARDENGHSRLDRAKEIARDIIDNVSGSDRAAIIETSSRVLVRCALTSDRSSLTAAIAQVQETDSPGSLTEACRLAAQIVKNERDAGIVVISDGCIEAPVGEQTKSELISSSSAAIRFIQVGNRSNNIGIVALNSRQLPRNDRREVFASIANFSDNDRTIGVELRIEDKLTDARTIDIAAHDRRALVFESVPDAGTLAELKLDVDDDLSADNIAFTSLPGTRRLKVGIDSDNPFLLSALATNSSVDLVKLSPASISGLDCVVTESATLPGKNISALLINPPDSADFWRVIGQRDRPEITSVVREHPVNRFLSYEDLHIEAAPIRETASWIKPVVTSGKDAIIWAGDDGHRRLVMIGFDLARSDLPVRVEFPILISNALSWLTGADSLSSDRTIRTGQPLVVDTSAEVLSVTTPAGDVLELASHDGAAVITETLRTGKYAVRGGTTYAASLENESESNTAPREPMRSNPGELSRGGGAPVSERELWRWLALFGLLILMIEWWIYHRRILV